MFEAKPPLAAHRPSPPASPKPESEAAAIEAEIERNVQRSAAMTDVILKEQRRVAELVLRHKDAWQRDLERHVSDAAALHRASIVAMEQTRQRLVEEIQVGGWLARFPETGGQMSFRTRTLRG